MTHYADFTAAPAPSGERIGLVIGNCQAESLRLALGAHDVRFIRTPPVHELTKADLPHLQAWAARADVLVSQPVRDDYHGLPVGTRQLAGLLRPGALLARIPVVRFAGLYPFQAIIRPPSDASLVPPLVPYHDLRVLAEAAGVDALAHEASPVAIREIAAESLAQLRSREDRHATVRISPLLREPSFALMRTINHPGNAIWLAMAHLVRAGLGLPERELRLEREILNAVHAPREPSVIDAWRLDAAATEHWTVNGTEVSPEELRDAHLEWYREHPHAVTAGLERHAPALAALTAQRRR